MLESKLKVALRQLPDSKELPVLLTDINSLGKNAGLEIKRLPAAAGGRKRDFYAEVPIEVEFSRRASTTSLRSSIRSRGCRVS